MLSPIPIIKIVETAGLALPPDRLAAQRKGTIVADGEACSVNGTSLRGLVELKLVVGGDITGAAILVHKDAVDKCDGEVVLALHRN